jgi:YD repeat-containing protein
VAYPDTQSNWSKTNGYWQITSGEDHVSYTYDRLGRRLTATDQRAVVHTYEFDSAGRLSADKVTNCPSGVDSTVLRIQRTYDDVGRMEKATSYDANTGGTVKNEVELVYDGWGGIARSYQDPNGSVSSTDPNVQYACGDGAVGNAAKYVRLEKVTYAGGRAVYYNYPTSGVGDMLSRVDNLADGNGASPTKYASYTYLGAGTVVEVDHPAVGGSGLKLTYKAATAGQYSGFDRFGRVAWQRWMRSSGSTAVDRFYYGYDRNSNRIWRGERSANAAGGRDEAYIYDGLDRLDGMRRGKLPDGAGRVYVAPYPGDADRDGDVDFMDYITVKGNNGQSGDWGAGDFNGDGYVDDADYHIYQANQNFNGTVTYNKAQEWDLEALGNWAAFRDGNGTTWDANQARLHNQANEIDVDDDHANAPGASITESGGGTGNWVDPRHDAAGSMVRIPRPGDEGDANDALLCIYDAWNRLVKVYDDQDGDGVLDVPGDALIATYGYDGLHRRVRKVVKGSPSDTTYEYLHDAAWQVLEVRKDGNSACPYKQYAWDLRYIDAPVVRWCDSDGDGQVEEDANEVLYYTGGANMEVTGLVDASATACTIRRWEGGCNGIRAGTSME